MSTHNGDFFMNTKNIPGTEVSSTLSAKATGSLDNIVQQELSVSDPSADVAKAVLDADDEPANKDQQE